MWWDHGLLNTAVTWGAIVIIVVVSRYFRHQSRIAKYQMLEKMAEKGQTIPPDVLARDDYRDRGCRDNATSGIMLMCVGIGLGLFFWALSGGYGIFHHPTNVPDWMVFVGVIPFMIGLGRLLTSLFVRPRPPSL